MLLGQDDMFHMTFIDWSDETKAKHLIFEPFNFPTSTQNVSQNEIDFSIFPNPTSDFLNIVISEKENFTDWSICDMANMTYNSGSINSNTKIDVRNLSPGSYFVKLYSEKTIIIKRLIIV